MSLSDPTGPFLNVLTGAISKIDAESRILAHGISQELTLSASGALIAATTASTPPVTVRVTQPGLATVVQYDLRMP